MNGKRKILCGLNLLLFLTSFTFLSFSGFTGQDEPGGRNTAGITVSTMHHALSNTVPQLSEENETEIDDDFEIQALELPFLLAHCFGVVHHSPASFIEAPVEQAGTPIYLEIHNLRV